MKRILGIPLVVAVLALVSLPAWKDSLAQTPQSPEPPKARSLVPVTPKNPAEKIYDCTVKVYFPDGTQGAGFVVRDHNGNCWVWTVAHVLEAGKQRIRVEVSPPVAEPLETDYWPEPWVRQIIVEDGMPKIARTFRCEVIRCDVAEDIALLRVRADKPVFLGDTDFAERNPRIGDPVWSCGAPEGLDQTVTSGIVSFIGRLSDTRLMDQNSAVSMPGSSGGPVADEHGRVIGLVHGGHGPGITLHVPTRVIVAWAEARGVSFALQTGGEPPDLAIVRAGGIYPPPPKPK